MNNATNRKRGRRGSPESWSVDGHVGQRLRTRRTLLGMSQEKLGEAIGLTFQQVQKYERGSNRISAGTLYRLGQVLDVPVSFFFDGFEEDGGQGTMAFVTDVLSGESINRRDARLLRLWRAAPNNIADEILSLLSALAPHADVPPVAPDIVETADHEPFPITETPIDDSVAKRQRRRHGAVWDPADIYRSHRSTRK